MHIICTMQARVIEVQMSSFDYASESSDRQTASLTSSESSSSSLSMRRDDSSFMQQAWYAALCEALFASNDAQKREFSNKEHSSLQGLGQMNESEFVLDMLVRLDLVDKRRHIDPLIQSFREFKENTGIASTDNSII